jgi:hypothetical protein
MPIGPTSGFLDFTNATPRANVIVALSNIGIGTDVPLHALDLRGTANVADIIINNDLTLTGGLTTNTLTINNVSMSTTSNFQQVTNVGNVTTNTVEFTNPTTGLTVTSNAEVGGELSVSGDATVSGGATVSGDATVSGNVGVGTTEPTESLDIVGNLNLQKVSNTASIKLNSNVVTEYTRSKKLIKYPRVAMTAATTAGYTASASSENDGITTGLAYLAFDGVAGGDRGYHSSGSLYSSGIYQGSAKLTGPGALEYDGEWIKLELPHKIKVTGVSFAPRVVSSVDYFHRIPRKGYILGSNTGSDGSWEVIHSFDNVTTTNGVTKRIDFVGTSAYYNNIAMVAEEVGLNASYGDVLNFAEMEYFGTLEYDPDADGTDVIVRSVPNVPNTDWLEVYYDGQDYTSMPPTVTDKSGNGLSGTPSGGVGFDTEYKAFTFDGVDDVVTATVSNHSLQGGYSMATWINPLVMADEDYIAVFGVGNSGTQIGINFDGTDALRAYVYGSGTIGIVAQTSNNRIRSGEWIHVTATYVSATGAINLYINDVLAATGSGTSLSSISSSAPLIIGARDTNGTIEKHANFKMANFRLFNRTLTSDEIWQLYAYQKEYFGHGKLDMTLKSGRLGIGTMEPRAVLDVKGDAKFDGPIAVSGTTVHSFTGQHVCFPYGDMEQGLVVSANKNKYVSLNGVTTGLSAIRSDESLPIVSLSNVSNDGSVFGVIHELETGGTTRNRIVGGVNTKTQKMVGDNRAVVNSLGEGAMWVANTNGNLVSGDYITTSNVAGYGQRQDDDILHNYTVAKITMDCDFNPQEVPVQVIKEELDSYGRIQWEDHPTETEKAYKIRYLDATGVQTDEANAVHTAAFVGVTYHCG